MKSLGTLRQIHNYGGFVSCHFVGASKCGFPFGFPCGVWYMKRGYKGSMVFKELELDHIT